MRRRLAGHPALHHAAFLQHHHQQIHKQDIDSEQESSCSESGRDRMNSPSDKESAGPSGKSRSATLYKPPDRSYPYETQLRVGDIIKKSYIFNKDNVFLRLRAGQ